MKVCQVCAVDFTVKNFLLPLIDGMEAEGWQVTAVCSDGAFVPDLRRRGYRLIPVPIARSMNPVLALRSVAALTRLFRQERFDIVHAHTPVAALVARVAARLAGVPLVIYTAHGFYFHDEMPGWKHRLFVGLERFGGWFTDLLFSQSSEDAEDAVRFGIQRADRVLAIGNGVDVSRFDPEAAGDGRIARADLGIPSEAVVIGCIGRQVREKGIVEFLQAARAVAVDHPQAYFLLVGERLASDHAPGVDEELAAARIALGDRLVTPGLRGDVPQCLAAMDVFCLPSWREGMPRTIIEAMMMGKPVLATNIRGAREEVIPEETGLLVPTRAPQALAAAMVRMIRDPGMRHRFGAAGRERALRLYDERKVVALQIQRIRQVLNIAGGEALNGGGLSDR